MVGWGEPHAPVTGGTGSTGEIELAHAALDKVGVAPGPLARRVLAYVGQRDTADEHGRPHTISSRDYVSDGGLTRIEELVTKLPDGFDLDQQVYAKTVVATVRFDKPKNVMERANDVPNLFEAAMCIDTLCKNLRAERAAR